MARLPILLIEDDPDDTDALTALLERFDYHSIVVSSGDEALAKLGQDKFAAVVIDLEMPNIDGIDCAHQIRQSQSAFRLALPVIGFTGHREAAEGLSADPNAIVAYLGKPPQAEELRRLLLRFVYDPAEPNLTTLRPVTEMNNWHEKRNGTN